MTEVSAGVHRGRIFGGKQVKCLDLWLLTAFERQLPLFLATILTPELCHQRQEDPTRQWRVLVKDKGKMNGKSRIR